MEEGLNAGAAALYQQGLQQDPELLRILVLIHKMGTKICTRKNSRKDCTLPTAWHRLKPTVAPISIDGDILTTGVAGSTDGHHQFLPSCTLLSPTRQE